MFSKATDTVVCDCQFFLCIWDVSRKDCLIKTDLTIAIAIDEKFPGRHDDNVK